MKVHTCLQLLINMHPKEMSASIPKEKSPNNDVSVGIAMGGKSAFAMMARPNWNLILSPHPVYWAVFGTFKEGEVLDVTSMSNIVKLNFPINKYHLDILLDEGNNWTVEDLLTSNKMFRESLAQK